MFILSGQSSLTGRVVCREKVVIIHCGIFFQCKLSKLAKTIKIIATPCVDILCGNPYRCAQYAENYKVGDSDRQQICGEITKAAFLRLNRKGMIHS